jgi:hypothetical protein
MILTSRYIANGKPLFMKGMNERTVGVIIFLTDGVKYTKKFLITYQSLLQKQ